MISNQIEFEYKYEQNKMFFIINGSKDFLERDVIRSEGNKKMKLIDRKLFIVTPCPNICNDHLALICILAFHPVLDAEHVLIKFPFAVSKNFLDSIKIPWILPNCEIVSEVDDLCEINYNLTGATLCYGGGLDSLAIRHIMSDFTDLKIVHQVDETAHETASDENVQYITSNIRKLYSVYGLPLWTSIMIFGIINKSKYILSGGQLTSSYLLNGIEYKDRTKNLWLSTVMKQLGIENYNFAFLSEVLNAEIVYRYNNFENAKFCIFSNNIEGKCHKCTKCLRKFMLMACYDTRYLNDIEKFDLTSDPFKQFFSGNNIYFADVFAFCVNKLLHHNGKNIEMINNHLDKFCISDSLFLSRYYKYCLDQYDGDLKYYIIQKLNTLCIHPMDDNDIISMMNYKQSKK